MSCCGEKEKEDDNFDDGLTRCCGGTGGQRCMCLPYDDPWPISAQILAIVAVLFSWIWWVTLIISGVAMIVLQIIWCCRQNKFGFLASIIVTALAAFMNLFTSIWIFIVWRRAEYCYPFDWYVGYRDDDYINAIYDDDFSVAEFEYESNYRYWDDCPEVIWGSVAAVSTAIWIASFACLLHFVCSGRHAKWEKRHRRGNGKRSKRSVGEDAAVDDDPETGTPAEPEATGAEDSAKDAEKGDEVGADTVMPAETAEEDA